MSRNNNRKIGETILANSGLGLGIFGTNVCKEEDSGWFCQFQRIFLVFL